MKISKTVCLGLALLILCTLTGPVFGFGNKEIPDIPPVTSGTQYISPDSNGVQDTAVLSFSVKIYVKSEEGYVPEYGLQILDSSGNVMKEVIETEKRDIGWLKSIFTGYKEFSLKRSITWDGTDQNGNIAPDGTYNVKMWVVDSSKNRKEVPVDDFVVDVRKPEALIVAQASMLFSPNGDNSMDSFEISHTQATSETLWEAEILDSAGIKVKTFSWKNAAPGRIVWLGLNDQKSPVSSGTYSYTLSAVDEAGNESGPIVLEGIILDLTATPIDLVIDTPIISPDGNGINDSMTVYLDQVEKEGIVSWEWQIRHENSTVYWMVSGKGAVPEELVIDGTDSKGIPMPEGNYSFIYKVVYKNGNMPTALESFIIDVTAPEISVSIDNPAFSPNNDGRKDKVEIQFKSDGVVTWEGSILNERGEEIISTSSDSTTSLIVWDGTDAEGMPAENGKYSVVAVFTDPAGNSTWLDPSFITLNKDPISISLKTAKGFSPNGDGVSDDLVILVDSNEYQGLSSWRLDVLNMKGETVKNISGTDILPTEVVWDGSLSAAQGEVKTAEEGSYSVRLSTVYDKGDLAEAFSTNFVLDVTPPEISVDVTSNPFAAGDGGVEGEVYVTLNVLDNSDINNWFMDVLNTDGDILRSYSGFGDPSGDITWNSAESNGPAPISLDNPDFVLMLTVTDIGNNESVFEQAIPLDILLVIKDGKKYLSVPNIIFGAYQHALNSAGDNQLSQNNASLDKVAAIYRKYPAFGLTLEGHALNIYLDGPREDAEEKILFPLTQRRADKVKDALAQRGLPAAKMQTQSFGGQFPIVSVTDKEVWGRNRRVEFVMTDPE